MKARWLKWVQPDKLDLLNINVKVLHERAYNSYFYK